MADVRDVHAGWAAPDTRRFLGDLCYFGERSIQSVTLQGYSFKAASIKMKRSEQGARIAFISCHSAVLVYLSRRIPQ